jgi:hypothetical protein
MGRASVRRFVDFTGGGGQLSVTDCKSARFDPSAGALQEEIA